MINPLTQNFVTAFMDEVQILLASFTEHGYHMMSAALAEPFSILATIYVATLGIAFMFGWAPLSMGQIVAASLRVSLISVAVLNWSFISNEVIALINGLTDGVANSLFNIVQNQPDLPSDWESGLQIVLNHFTEIGQQIFNKLSMFSWGPLFSALIVWGFGYIVVGIALFEIVLSKILIAVLFVILPLVVLACFFKNLQGIFDRWLGIVVGAVVLQFLVKAVLALAILLANWWYMKAVVHSPVVLNIGASLPLILIGIICVGLICKSSIIAYTIGGGFCTFSGSAMFGRTAGSLFGGVVGVMKTTLSGVATAAQTGSRSAHMVMSVAHRVRHLQRNIRRGDE